MEHTELLFLFTCQPTKSSNFSRSGVNVRAHLLRKNYSRNFSSIRSAPYSVVISVKILLVLNILTTFLSDVFSFNEFEIVHLASKGITVRISKISSISVSEDLFYHHCKQVRP